ncbi:hypothetical protein Pmani_013800 [Petrolisthes manimaculis]|uniref:Gustatory receptor n=1 Tax=Petrolisthes manimaculis TaxID=1843537 RepID=A0AAE1UBS8_9EUCA|nr:hypothetical protein Pmani_013800 [Petrolisthes manimaculis]
MRLPPESTLGLIPWRALVVGLQVVGAFPYILGKGNQKPRFSIPLFLWSIFIHMFSLTGILMVVRFTSSYLSISAAVGSKAFFYSGCTTLVTFSLSPLALMINSKKLAYFLWDTDLIEKTTSVLSKHLAAQANVILQLNATETDDRDSATLISAFHALKNTGRKVEKRMGLLLACLFPLINIYLVPSIVGAVCSSYALLSPRVPNESPIPFFFVAYLVIFRLCRVGAHFVRQVREVVSELAGLQRFSVCGWYCLDYSTLLTIVSTVVTYLVIMGQVGDIPTTQIHSSTSVPASS